MFFILVFKNHFRWSVLFCWISILVSVSRAFLDDDENEDKLKTVQTNDAVVMQYKELIREQASLENWVNYFVMQINTVGIQKALE